jgi:hypothetical protein
MLFSGDYAKGTTVEVGGMMPLEGKSKEEGVRRIRYPFS